MTTNSRYLIIASDTTSSIVNLGDKFHVQHQIVGTSTDYDD